MDFKDFFSKERIDQDFFWALVIEPGTVQAAIWIISEEKAHVVSISKPVFWSEDEEMISACDAVLSSAIQNFPEDITEPSKTVFGISEKWVENGEIKIEYLEKIKKICTDLSLEPSGFVILSEAISHLIKSEEGSPLSAIIIATREDSIEISLFKLGNLVGSTTVARSVSLPDDVVEGLTRFGLTEPFPSRFLIYDGKEGELEEVKQNLLSYDWELGEKIKFLHTPKIEIIQPEQKVTATALAGASEISNIKKIEFLKKEDEEVASENENVSVPQNLVRPEDLGFSIGEDVEEKEKNTESIQQEIIQEQPEDSGVKPQERRQNLVFEKISKIPNLVKSFFKKKPVQKTDFKQNKKTFLYGGVVFTVLLVIGFFLWWFLPKATLTVYVSPKKLKEKVDLVIDSQGSTNLAKGVISGKLIEVTEDGEKTKATTGTKTIGEKAKGSVKIQNGTSSAIRLGEGIIIYSSSDLGFTLDKSASISAAVSPSLPGEGNVDVTATSIGAEYNLAKDEIFKVSNYLKSEVDAVALSDFTGGSSRQISAVSIDDQEELFDDLENELLGKAKSEIKAKLADGEYFIDDSMVATASSKIFSNKVGDEASNLKLNLGLLAQGIVVANSDFYDFIKDSLKDQIPSGFVLRNDQISFQFELREIIDSQYTFEIAVEVNLLPQIDTENIVKTIKGKNEKVVKEFLSTVPGFTRAEVKFMPKLPGKLNTFPHVSKNINIELTTER